MSPIRCDYERVAISSLPVIFVHASFNRKFRGYEKLDEPIVVKTVSVESFSSIDWGGRADTIFQIIDHLFLLALNT